MTESNELIRVRDLGKIDKVGDIEVRARGINLDIRRGECALRPRLRWSLTRFLLDRIAGLAWQRFLEQCSVDGGCSA